MTTPTWSADVFPGDGTNNTSSTVIESYTWPGGQFPETSAALVTTSIVETFLWNSSFTLREVVRNNTTGQVWPRAQDVPDPVDLLPTDGGTP